MTERDSSFNLRIDTNLTPSYNSAEPSSQDAVPPSPRSPKRDRSGSSSLGLMPPFRIPSTSPADGVPSHRGPIPQGASRARHESRKLLSHVLSQLQRRPLPPPVLNGSNIHFDTIYISEAHGCTRIAYDDACSCNLIDYHIDLRVVSCQFSPWTWSVCRSSRVLSNSQYVLPISISSLHCMPSELAQLAFTQESCRCRTPTVPLGPWSMTCSIQ